jgi:hypothetical protein
MSKPNKMDVRVRYMTTHAVELDWLAFKERSAIFGGRLGEYTTTHEVFVPGAIVREVTKAFKNPGSRAAFTEALRVLSSFAGQQTLAGVAAGAAGTLEEIFSAASNRAPEPSVTTASEVPSAASPEVDLSRFRNMRPKKEKKVDEKP